MKIKNSLPLILFMLFGLFCIAFGQTPKEVFNEANKCYAKGDWQKAADLYNQLLENGEKTPELYYNLGNTNLKMQKVGLALLNFERAARIAPQDTDIRFNLEFARKLCGEPEPSFIESALMFLPNQFTLNQLALLCSALFVLLSGVLITYFVTTRKKLLFVALAIFCALVLFLLFFGIKLNAEKFSSFAIVVKSPAEVRNGPSDENSVGFSLPEGRKVLLLGKSGQWVAVGLKTEGYKGWVQSQFVEKI